MKISQVGSIAEGALADELVRRVLARFPDLDTPNRPTPDTITELLKNLGYDVVRGSDSRLYLSSSTQISGHVRLAQPHSCPPDTVNRHRRGGRARRGPARPRLASAAASSRSRPRSATRSPSATRLPHSTASPASTSRPSSSASSARSSPSGAVPSGRPSWPPTPRTPRRPPRPASPSSCRRPGPALRSTSVPSATAVSFSCTTPRPSHGTRAASSCSRSSRWPPGTRTNRRLACGCSAPWRTRSPRRNSTG